MKISFRNNKVFNDISDITRDDGSKNIGIYLTICFDMFLELAQIHRAKKKQWNLDLFCPYELSSYRYKSIGISPREISTFHGSKL